MRSTSKSKHSTGKHLTHETGKIFSVFRIKKITVIAVAAAIAVVGTAVPLAVSNTNKNTTDANSVDSYDGISYTDARITEAQNLAAAATAVKTMSSNIKVPVFAYALKADGKTIAVMTSDDEIRKVLASIKKSAEKGYDAAETEFVENVEILEGMYTSDAIIDTNQLKEYLSTKYEAELTYTVKKDDTKKSIAKYYGITVNELIKLNPDIKDRKIKVGDKLKIVTEKLPISIKLTVTETKTSKIKFEKETVEDDSLSTSYKKITTEGKDGEKETTSNIIYIDGREAVKDVVSENIITEPVNEITTVGTNENPGASLGKFSWPLPNYFTITSEFGPRWGTNHNGLDISGGGVYGADITASDGGEVTLSQEDNSGYGKYVIIDHGNGYQTLYGHCSELYVSVGDKVNAGQKIAAVGSTGYSTGPHLHFEIIKDGTKVDPMPYIKDEM